MSDIFISYSRHDSDVVNEIVTLLEQEGYSVWIDRDGIESGEDFKEKIARAIKECSVVLFFSSEHSNVSDWTAKEIGIAVKYKKHIIPILLDGSNFNEAVEFDLINLDYVDYSKASTRLVMRERLFKALRNKLGNGSKKNEQMEAERKAKAEAERARLEKERIAKAEAERRARETAERERIERERKAEEARLKAEKERKEKERLEAERKVKQAEERARLEKERIAKAETERKARETAERERVERERIYKALFDDMLDDMMKYKASVMQVLFGKIPPTDEMRNEDSPIGHFLKAGLRLSFNDLYERGILPKGNHTLEEAIFKNDFEIPQFSLEDFGEVPVNRNDIYLLGVQNSGKSSMLAGVLNYLHYVGQVQYQPTRNAKGIDGVLPYYNALIRSTSEYKAPLSTGVDTVSFVPLNIGPNFNRKVTVMELSGNAFKCLVDANYFGREVWERLGMVRCLNNNNFKTLFFLVDYKNPFFTVWEQIQILETTLELFCSDGTGRNGQKNCTMSKVKTVAIVITKADMMDVEEGKPLTMEERGHIAIGYLHERFSHFLKTLADLCKLYGINANASLSHSPWITTFSLGRFFIGNTLVYDNTDSKRLAELILAATERRRGFLNFL